MTGVIDYSFDGSHGAIAAVCSVLAFIAGQVVKMRLGEKKIDVAIHESESKRIADQRVADINESDRMFERYGKLITSMNERLDSCEKKHIDRDRRDVEREKVFEERTKRCQE
jgi:hypothetical protein